MTSLINPIMKSGIQVVKGMTVKEQLVAAGLDWEVKIAEAIYKVNNGDYHVAPDTRIAYRADTGAQLGTYGKSRNAYSNEEIITTFNTFCTDNNLELTRIGSFYDGKELFAIAKLPIDVKVGPRQLGDITDAYTILRESHENGHALNISAFWYRLKCLNGMVQKVKEFSSNTNHSTELCTKKLTEQLEASINKTKEYETNLNILAETPITRDEAILLLIASFGNAKKTLEEQPPIVRTCLRLFDGQAIGSEMIHAYKTAYALLQSVTEYTTHHSKATKEKASSLISGSLANSNAKIYNSLLTAYSPKQTVSVRG